MASLRVSRKGFALVVSLFLVMILYTGITVMLANLNTDLRASSQAMETVQYRAASQGAVNKLYVLLKNGESATRYTAESPLKVDVGEFKDVEAWVVEDENSGIFHLFSKIGGVSFSRVVTRRSESGARTYINDAGVLKSTVPGGSSWSPLPEPPRRLHIPGGAPMDLEASDPMTCWNKPSANANGQVVAGYHIRKDSRFARALYLFDEDTRSWTDVTPPNSSHVFYYDDVEPVALGENTMFTWVTKDDFHHPDRLVGEFRHFDLGSKTWSDPIPTPFNGGRIDFGFVGPNDTFVAGVKDRYNVLHAVEYVNGEWKEFPPLPGGLSRINANGPKGEVYATSQDGQLYRFEDGQWDSMTVPFLPENLKSVDAAGALIFCDNEKDDYFRCEESSEPVELPEAEDVKGIAGGGTPAETQAEGYKTTATF